MKLIKRIEAAISAFNNPLIVECTHIGVLSTNVPATIDSIEIDGISIVERGMIVSLAGNMHLVTKVVLGVELYEPKDCS